MKKSLFIAGLVGLSTLGASTLTQAADVLHLYNWNNYIAEPTLKRFEASCKCTVKQEYYDSMEKMLAKLAAGAKGYDILVPTGFALEALVKQKALKPLDKAQISNLKNINPTYLNTAFDKGNVYSAPYVYSTTILGYNEQKLKELGLPNDTWALIFDPKYLEKLKGKVTVLDDPVEVMAAAMKYLGYSANDTDEKKLQQAAEVIKKAKPYWAAFNSTYIPAISRGDIWIAHGYSSDFYQANQDVIAAKRKFTIGFSAPKEGATMSLDSLVIHKDAPRPDLAMKFINFMLDAKNGAELPNLTGTGSPNAEAQKLVKPEVAKNQAIFPDANTMKRLEMLKDTDSKTRRTVNKLWTQIKVK